MFVFHMSKSVLIFISIVVLNEFVIYFSFDSEHHLRHADVNSDSFFPHKRQVTIK